MILQAAPEVGMKKLRSDRKTYAHNCDSIGSFERQKQKLRTYASKRARQKQSDPENSGSLLILVWMASQERKGYQRGVEGTRRACPQC